MTPTPVSSSPTAGHLPKRADQVRTDGSDRMMRIKLDRTVCDGFGVCGLRAPDSFTLDEWGYAALADRTGMVPAEREPAVRNAMSGCPVQAITELDPTP